METPRKIVSEQPQKASGIKKTLTGLKRRLLSKAVSNPEYTIPGVLYDFPILGDPSFLSSPYKADLDKADIKGQTIKTTEAVMQDLEIPQVISVITDFSQKPADQTPIFTKSGIGAYVSSPTEVHFHIDPTNPNSVESITSRRERQIAHELNHVARFQAGQTPNNLLDFLIGEGLAAYYEEHWQGVFQPGPWHQTVDVETVQNAWQKALPNLDQTQDIRDRWFNGKSDLPQGTGYVMGIKIVESYFKNNQTQTMKDLIKLPSSVILQGSDFRG